MVLPKAGSSESKKVSKLVNHWVAHLVDLLVVLTAAVKAE